MPSGTSRFARHADGAGSHRLRRAFAGLSGVAVAAAVLLAMSPAQAAATNDRAQLALSGLADKNNPAGGSRIGIHPGDSVTFSAASVPTAGLAKLGLSNLIPTVDNLLNGATRFQVRANFANLPGGRNGTILRGHKTAHFAFAHTGTYNFTWTVQKVTVLSTLLGKQTKTTTINLNGNELRQAGIKLNAHNQYVGQVVVRKHPPAGGISVQLPKVRVAPSAPGVGQLPTLKVPSVKLPSVHVSIPKVKVPSVPGLPTGGNHSGGGNHQGTGTNPGGGAKNFAGPPLSVPEEVVPKGDTAITIPGSDNLGALPVYHGSNAFRPTTGSGNQAPGVRTVARQPRSADAAKRRPLGLATKPTTPSGQLPVLLAIISIIALALVAGTYARLFLIRRKF
jgi:hypothetical protein